MSLLRKYDNDALCIIQSLCFLALCVTETKKYKANAFLISHNTVNSYIKTTFYTVQKWS